MFNMEEEEEQQRVNQSIQNSSDQLKMAVQGKLEVFDAGLVNLSITSWGEYVRISIQTPPGKDPVHNDVVVVLDISGSMDTIAEVKNQQGVKENNGLTILDLLKHSTKTIIHNLDEKDRFCLVSYSDQGRIEFSLRYMTEENKILATIATENLETEGNTNLWGGLYCGMEVLRNHPNSNHHQTIMLLTDGEPNIHPPSGEINQLIKYRSQFKDFQPTIHTYAQGKKINSELLNQYAFIGNGQYNFIPCPGFIGTIFVNSIGYILSTFASGCELVVEPLNEAKIESVPGGLPYKQNKIQVGNLQFEQSRDIIVKLTQKYPESIQNNKPFLNANISFFDHRKNQKITGRIINQIKFQQDDPLAGMHLCRITFVDQVKQAVLAMKQNNQEKAKNIIKELSQFIRKMISDIEIIAANQFNNENADFIKVRAEIAIKYLVKLLQDVDGEATLAVAQTWSFEQWGQHYLPSISHAHLKQQKNNYMDPGIQSYGGKFISDITDRVEQTFLNLPAPKPSRKKQIKGQKPNILKHNHLQIHTKKQPEPTQSPKQNKIQSREPSPEPAIDMNLYYQGGGCFFGNCIVTLANNQNKQVKNVKKGDLVQSIDGSINQVVAIVKIFCEKSKTLLVSIDGGLLITPKHPVFWRGKWVKPSEIKQPIEVNCEAVYNFILDGGHTININGYQCVTLGHGFKEDQLVHPYFGTDLVLKDLKLSQQYNHGFIELRMKQFVRDQQNQQICGLKNIY